MAERRDVDVAQLRKREHVRRECEADVGVRELSAQAVAPGENDVAVVERGLRELVDRAKARSAVFDMVTNGAPVHVGVEL